MKVSSCFLLLLFLVSDDPQQQVERQLILRPAAQGWGVAAAEDVRRVLTSSATALWQAAGKPQLPVIEVSSSGGPIVLHRRGPEGEIRVRLATKDRYWCQYAYQFAHEMGHILCSFDDEAGPNEWFEESLCELASLYALGMMAEEWRKDPPAGNWRDYSRALADYRQRLLDRGQLPAGIDLATWFGEEEVFLRETSTDRRRNLIVAVALLPIFEEKPEAWQALSSLNRGVPFAEESFGAHLGQWLASSARGHHRVIRTIARKFKVGIESPASGQSP